WPVPPLEGIPVTARLRHWDAAAGQPGDIIAEATGTASAPLQGQASLGVSFPPVPLDSGRYVVTLVDPDVPDEAIQLFLSPTRRERETSWVNGPANATGQWLHFGDVDPSLDSDLHMQLT